MNGENASAANAGPPKPGKATRLMAKKRFNYIVTVSFQMQFSFPESEVEQSDEGAEGDMSPTDEALEALEEELAEFLGQNYGGICNMEAWADFDELLSTYEE